MIKTIKPSYRNCNSGIFTPTNREKYVGKYPIIFRSDLERKFCVYCDNSASVRVWSNESIEIPYIYSVDKSKHRYYPDFYIEHKNNNDEYDKIVVEIKPHSQTSKPKQPKKQTKLMLEKYNNRLLDFIKNMNKWQFAENYCLSRNYKFMIITEKWFNK